MDVEKKTEALDIDIMELLQVLMRRAWAIILAALIAGTAAFGYSTYYITPQYQSSALLFVNSGTFSLDSKVFTISSGSVSNASDLVSIYIVILKTRMTLNQVIEKAKLPYSYDELSEMISAAAVENTGIFSITVTSPDPTEAQLIANTIAEVLQIQIAEVVDGSSVRVVDYAVVPDTKSSPDISRYTLVGLLVGALLTAAVIVVFHLLDTTIHSSEDLTHSFDLPVLAEIPDLFTSKAHRYGGYRSYSKYGYKYGYQHGYNKYGYEYGYGYGKKHHKVAETGKKEDKA